MTMENDGTDLVTLIRHKAAVLHFSMACAQLRSLLAKANFNPDQPRIPAGEPDGGQWILVGDVGQRRYDIDLLEEERRGGHTIAVHVGKSEQWLIERIRNNQIRSFLFSSGIYRAGSFPSVAAATKLINSTLAQNSDIVAEVVSGVRKDAFVTAVFSSKTGVEAFIPKWRRDKQTWNPFAGRTYVVPVLRDTDGVGVYILPDPTSRTGFRIVTAFPRRD